MDRGVRSAAMRHSHAEAKMVADRLPELLVEQIQLPQKRSDEHEQQQRGC